MLCGSFRRGIGYGLKQRGRLQCLHDESYQAIVSLRRGYSQETKPNVKTIIPKTSVLRRYLYELKVPLSLRKVVGTYNAYWIQPDNETPPAGVNGYNLMQLKDVLEKHRKRTNTINRNSIELENRLVEAAAELGEPTAVALLCGSTLMDTNSSPEDLEHGEKLLKQLMQEKFPLAFKVSADIAYKYGLIDKAVSLYTQCLQYDDVPSSKYPGLKDSVKSECFRSIGFIKFTAANLNEARQYFELAIEQSDSPAQVMDCHFYLSQILEDDKVTSRYHLEQAARFGLKQAFAPLGFLLMNYFNRLDLAVEWFKLGVQLGELHCIIGLFDLYVQEKSYDKARDTLESIQKLAHTEGGEIEPAETDQDPNQTINSFFSSRAKSIELISQSSTTLQSSAQSQGRWDF